MTEKRYFAHKHLFRENKVHDKICHNFMSLDETVEHLNNEYWKYKQLKKENEQLKQFIKELTTKGTGKIDLASGYSYNVSAVLTDYRGDADD